MSELPYTRGSRENAEEPTGKWVAQRNEADLKRTVASIVDAEAGPQQYAASGERLEIALHKKAQDLMPAGTKDRYAAVNELVAAEKQRRAEGLGSGRE